MAYDEILAQRVRQRLSRRKNVEEKKMFAGLAFLLNGNLLVGVRKDSLLVRLSPEESDDVVHEPHVSEFRIKGRGAMKGWVVVGLEAIEHDDQLGTWKERALKFVAKLPAKKK